MLADEESCEVSAFPPLTNYANRTNVKQPMEECENGKSNTDRLDESQLEATNHRQAVTRGELNTITSQYSGQSLGREYNLEGMNSSLLSGANTSQLFDSSSRKSTNFQSTCTSDINKSNDSNLPYANLNSISHEQRDKIWSLNEPTNNEDFVGGGQATFLDNINQGMSNVFTANCESRRAFLPSSSQADLTDATSSVTATSLQQQKPPSMRRPVTGTSSYNSTQSMAQLVANNRAQLGLSANHTASNSYYHTSNQQSSGKNPNQAYSNLNWSLFSQVPPPPTQQQHWANMAIANNSTGSNSWSNNFYNGINFQKRPPNGSQANLGHSIQLASANKKLLYSSDNQSTVVSSSGLSPSKYRRNPVPNFKGTYTNSNVSGVPNLYDLGSAGSDNTSSSSDSANLRDNGHLLHLQHQQQQQQDRNVTDLHGSPLDTMRYSLEPQLLEIMRGNNIMHENKGFGLNAAYQTSLQDEKKHLKSRNFGRRRGKSPFFTGTDTDNLISDFLPLNAEPIERFSRKVFVGGLPPDIDEEEITASFRRFGPLVVDWPHKAESKSYFPPKGYAFLLFQEEASVQLLIDACIQEDDKLYLCVSSPTIKDKPVQIRPWRLSDADYVLDGSMPLDPRKTVFVGGVPRPLKAVELAMIMDRLYGGVCYAGIDTDPELKYPKGAGRVAFSTQQSYIAAISARFVQLQHADIEKRVEVKPYVLDDQICDECGGMRCSGKFAPYFCANITCLQYYCENCWANIHSRPGREFHKPLVKEGADRPRAVPFRWC